MAQPSPLELEFGRTFTLVILLVVVPSAGLSGFGVLAIINERAAVEKKIEAAWGGRLEALAQSLNQTLSDSQLVLDSVPPAFVAPDGLILSDASFRIVDGQVSTEDTTLAEILRPFTAELLRLGPMTRVFSLQSSRTTLILAAQQRNGQVEGVRLSLFALNRLLSALPGGKSTDEPEVRFEVRVPRLAPEGGKGASEISAAGALPPLAMKRMPAPLDEVQLVAVPQGEDPIAQASTRNRVIYSVLLGLFYLALVIGIVYTGRTLYREARLSRLKTDFVSLVSHELRTPLTSIRMFIETLSLGRVTDPRQTQEVLTLLSQETTRLSEMIERVLDWARIESGRKLYKLETVPVSDVVESAVTAFRTHRMGEMLKLTVNLPPGLPPINADRQALGDALLNLLQNAFKYSGEDKRIDLSARIEDEGVAIDVKDYGPGIPVRERKRIFERFYRVDNLLTRKTEGSGLGLSISQRILLAHGGNITVTSEVGKGSVFTLHLPNAGRLKP